MSQQSFDAIEPPHDLQAERNCLGAMAYRRANVPVVIDTGLEPGHFYAPDHARWYGTLFESWCNDEGIPNLSSATLGSLADCIYHVPEASDPARYARIVLDTAIMRHGFYVAAGIEPPEHVGWPEWWAVRR